VVVRRKSTEDTSASGAKQQILSNRKRDIAKAEAVGGQKEPPIVAEAAVD